MTNKYSCAIITPVGPGHETLYEEALASVHASYQGDKGIFTEVVPLKIDDREGAMGRSKARNTGIKKAAELGTDWIFFLDADDLMAPHAFGSVAPYLNDFDAIWGSVWTIEPGETIAHERPYQLPFLTDIGEVIRNAPVVTLQMGHFVRTSVALGTLFDEMRKTGEDFDYYLRVWEKHRCIKIPLPLFYNRRGLHSSGPRAATGREWREAVAPIMNEYRRKYGIPDNETDG